MHKRSIFTKFKHHILSNSVFSATEYLSPKEILFLEEIRKEFDAKYNSFSIKEKEDFLSEFLIRFTYNSNAIDGNDLSLDDTRKVILQHTFPEKAPKNLIDAHNSKLAFDFLLEYKGKNNKKLMLKLHSILMDHVNPDAGKLRDHEVEIYGSYFMPPGAELVEVELEKIIESLNESREHVFEKACIFHLRLVSLHPFLEGNGRIARMLFNYILWKEGYPMVVFPFARMDSYFNSLEKCHEEDSPRAFITWMKREYLK
ncbi:MAG: Fic family protein [archaeon]